ncbi:MAG: hypothetical protein DHS20C13_17500 [Thermodesulfobacteriota bacterium]|nr:MAG: hypothetical protein DHS20C13_17500 [Thermodesulfobacteriota bacterium]
MSDFYYCPFYTHFPCDKSIRPKVYTAHQYNSIRIKLTNAGRLMEFRLGFLFGTAIQLKHVFAKKVEIQI